MQNITKTYLTSLKQNFLQSLRLQLNLKYFNRFQLICRIILYTTLLSFSAYSYAFSIIRDSEIEEVLNQIAEPIFKSAKVYPKILVVNNNEINAFTEGANYIYLFSGLIKKFDDIDTIRAVIAHEIGHIVAGHVYKTDGIEAAQKIIQTSILAGVATAIAGNPGISAGIISSGMESSRRTMLKFSRSEELIADQIALKLLEASRQSSKGFINIMKSFTVRDMAITKHISPYDLTHPTSQERIIFIKNFHTNSKFYNSTNSKKLADNFARARIKLIAFTENIEFTLQNHASNSYLDLYARAIAYLRQRNKVLALKNIDKLLSLSPNDPYYNELKGQILLECHDKSAIDFFGKALSIKPKDTLFNLIFPIAYLNTQGQAEESLIKMLENVIKAEPENYSALYYLAITYEKLKKNKEYLFNMALYYKKQNLCKEASMYAKELKKISKENTPFYYKAEDIMYGCRS